jgi:hypothetical protein
METRIPSSFASTASPLLAGASARIGWRQNLVEKLYSLWLGLVLVAVIAAGFTLSYFAYARLSSKAPATSVETYND